MAEIERLKEEIELLHQQGDALDQEHEKLNWKYEVLQDAIASEQDSRVRGTFVMRSGLLQGSMVENRAERAAVDARLKDTARALREENRFDETLNKETAPRIDNQKLAMANALNDIMAWQDKQSRSGAVEPDRQSPSDNPLDWMKDDQAHEPEPAIAPDRERGGGR
jgi:hypothetical protein